MEAECLGALRPWGVNGKPATVTPVRRLSTRAGLLWRTSRFFRQDPRKKLGLRGLSSRYESGRGSGSENKEERSAGKSL